jgi:heat shock protein HtpX
VPQAIFAARKWANLVHSLLLFGAMVLLCGLLGWVVAGESGLVWALGLGVMILVLTPGLSPRMILRFYGARPLAPTEAPALFALTRELARRAGLAVAPDLAYVPSQTPNAFTVGRRNQAVIAVTDGLLRALTGRELAGVLAHELGHVAGNDMWIMALADVIARITALLSTLGWLLLFFSLPALLLAGYSLPLAPALVLVLAPAGTTLLQLALSRSREHDADLSAAALTGDPEGLATALGKIEARTAGMFERIFFPSRRNPQPSVLRTHPDTDERVARLLELPRDPSKWLDLDWRATAISPGRRPVRRPRWRPGGFWY